MWSQDLRPRHSDITLTLDANAGRPEPEERDAIRRLGRNEDEIVARRGSRRRRGAERGESGERERRARVTDPRPGTVAGFGFTRTIVRPLFMSLTYASPSRTIAPQVKAAFGTFPVGKVGSTWAISRCCAPRSPRRSPEISMARNPALNAPM